MSRKLMVVFSTLLVAGMILIACAPPATPVQQPPQVQTELVVQTQQVIVQATAVPTPPPPPPEPKTMIICIGQEPDTLYIYGGAMTAALHVQHAVYDGPIDNRSFAYQPIIIDYLPYLDTGDAVINTVTVGVGDKVLTADDEPIVLSEDITVPVRLREAGCYDDSCAIGWLPVSGTLEMEQMVVKFTLVDGLTWADGTPVTAEDSVYSFELYMDPDTPNPSRYTGERTAAYEALDDKTLQWTGLPGYRDSVYFTNLWQPLPKHQWDYMTAAEIVASEEASRVLLGYGGFTIEEWVAGDHITAIRNPYYFRADEGLPYVSKVIYRFIGEDPNTAIAALLAGECDILTQDLSLDQVAELMQELEAKGQMVPQFVTGTSWEHVDFGINPVESYERPDFFEDVRMREAFGMCLNRQQVVDELLYGMSVVPATYIPPTHPMFEGSLEPLPYDVAAANALLDELGWVDGDGDGVRECSGCGVAGAPDGTRLSFKWQSTTAPLRVAYMQIFQQQLLDCGIEIILDNMPAGAYFAQGPEGPLWGRHFDVASFTFGTGVEPPCGLYLSSQIPSEENGWAGQNDQGYSNAEYDLACSTAIQSLPGTTEYEQYHKESQRIFRRDIPALPLFLRLKIAAARLEVKNFIMDPTSNSECWNIEMFDLEMP